MVSCFALGHAAIFSPVLHAEVLVELDRLSLLRETVPVGPANRRHAPRRDFETPLLDATAAAVRRSSGDKKTSS